jgi:peptidoglycan/xylan/chitin deacetylase (PgdA/CDA1 family)
LAESRERLVSENAADPSVIPFSYPNGNYDERAARIVADTGYACAVTTEKGWNAPNSPRFLLKRVSIHQDVSCSEAVFGCRIAGFF